MIIPQIYTMLHVNCMSTKLGKGVLEITVRINSDPQIKERVFSKNIN